jgi:cytochrome c
MVGNLKSLLFATGVTVITASWGGAALGGNSSVGATVFKTQCAACHSVLAQPTRGIGPQLFRVVGRRAGSVPGFAYSPAMKASKLTWNAATLRIFLDNPAKTVKGNKMPYAGLHNPAQLDDLIAYLMTLK